ncbi:MAG: hypothetical protein FWF95_01760 [Syntrophorhabdaceae bacterium]|nr:hypothetical protein [Syntrophorhabdaceae bacterium]
MEDERAYPKEKLPCDVRCIEADSKDGLQTYMEERVSSEEAAHAEAFRAASERRFFAPVTPPVFSPG